MQSPTLSKRCALFMRLRRAARALGMVIVVNPGGGMVERCVVNNLHLR